MITPFAGMKSKILLFGLLGAIGCLSGAVIGELFLGLTRKPAVPPRSIVLLLDCSGSMAGAKLAEMKEAARQFVERQELSKDRVAVIGFGSHVHPASGLSGEKGVLQTAVTGLSEGGSTNMPAGLSTALTQLSSDATPGKTLRNILLFTDGMPQDQAGTRAVADQCRQQDVRIVVVATGDANVPFLASLTQDPKLVFPANVGSFAAAFAQAEKAIKGLAESESSGGGLFYGLFRTSVWTALLAVGACLALVGGQSYYLRRTFPPVRVIVLTVCGGLLAGLVAGGCGQLVFAVAPESVGRIIGWCIFGALLGLGLAFVVPNLSKLRGLQGGASGGVLGAVGFLLGAVVLADLVGRWSGAILLGFCIGIMIAFFEAVFRRFWIEIRYGPSETRIVSLGPTPITVGGDPQRCTILARNAPPVALRYTLQGSQVLCEDVPAERMCTVAPGDSRTAGTVTIVVCGAGERDAGAAITPPRCEGSSSPPSERPSPPPDSSPSTGTPPPVATTPPTGFRLRVGGQRIPLGQGDKLTAVQLPGISSQAADGIVAEVVPNPQQPEVFGLKNTSTTPWTAFVQNEQAKAVPPGRSIKLAANTRIEMGPLTTMIELIP